MLTRCSLSADGERSKRPLCRSVGSGSPYRWRSAGRQWTSVFLFRLRLPKNPSIRPFSLTDMPVPSAMLWARPLKSGRFAGSPMDTPAPARTIRQSFLRESIRGSGNWRPAIRIRTPDPSCGSSPRARKWMAQGVEVMLSSDLPLLAGTTNTQLAGACEVPTRIRTFVLSQFLRFLRT